MHLQRGRHDCMYWPHGPAKHACWRSGAATVETNQLAE
jgi:hypothetical protein